MKRTLIAALVALTTLNAMADEKDNAKCPAGSIHWSNVHFRSMDYENVISGLNRLAKQGNLFATIRHDLSADFSENYFDEYRSGSGDFSLQISSRIYNVLAKMNKAKITLKTGHRIVVSSVSEQDGEITMGTTSHPYFESMKLAYLYPDGPSDILRAREDIVSVCATTTLPDPAAIELK